MSKLPLGQKKIIPLIVIDDDPVFRLGLATALGTDPGFQIVAQLDSKSAPDRLLNLQWPTGTIALLECLSRPDLPQFIHQTYPTLTILLLSAITEPRLLVYWQQLGLAGYLPKGTNIENLKTSLGKIHGGDRLWARPPQNFSPRPWFSQLRYSSLGQIERSLQETRAQLQQSLPYLDRLFWEGVARELRMARWLVQSFLPIEVMISPGPRSDAPSLPETQAIALPQPETAIVPFLLTQTLNKIQKGIIHHPDLVLEIDILRPEKQQELLFLALQQIDNRLTELKFLHITPEQIPPQIELIFREIWQNTTIAFLSRYDAELTQTDNLMAMIRQNGPNLAKTRLQKVPLLVELLTYLVTDSPLVIAQIAYPPESSEAKLRGANLLENFLLQIANGTVQFLLNYQPEKLKYSLYNQQYLSSREIARFRNELSWRYRLRENWIEPRAIFESKYRLLVWELDQIEEIEIYAPRLAELQQLRGIPLLTTLLLEFRDAIAPRLYSLVQIVGHSLVYILTNVLGRGIGLIGQGILQGLGNALQETRYRRK